MAQAADRRDHLYDLLKDFDAAMLVTRSRDGGIHARPMSVAELRRDGDGYFVTELDSPKMVEIEADPRVTLTFQSSSQFATISGTARLLRDRALVDRLWREAWRVWFPKGKDDPSLCLIAFQAERGEYWDNAGAQGVRYAWEAAKSYMQGKKPATDEKQHAKVTL